MNGSRNHMLPFLNPYCAAQMPLPWYKSGMKERIEKGLMQNCGNHSSHFSTRETRETLVSITPVGYRTEELEEEEKRKRVEALHTIQACKCSNQHRSCKQMLGELPEQRIRPLSMMLSSGIPNSYMIL
jgi:hypothetical protein